MVRFDQDQYVQSLRIQTYSLQLERAQNMSIYNGFINHDQESRYYQLIKYLVSALEKRLIKFYRGEPCNESKFIKLISKIRYKIVKMESKKYNQPKFGDSIGNLMQTLDVPFNQHFSQHNLRASKFDRLQSNFSHISLDFSLAPDAHLSHEKQFKAIPQFPFETSQRRKRYKSLQKARNESILQYKEYRNQSKFSNKLKEFGSLKSKLRQPKIDPFIENIRKQSNEVINSARKLRVLKQMDSFLGQRRKKVKKNIRINPFKP